MFLAKTSDSTFTSVTGNRAKPIFLAPPKRNSVRVRPEHFPSGIVDPAAYALQLVGNCLEPEFYHGDMAICSPAASIEPRNFVVFWFVEEGKAPMLKRLVMLPHVPVGTLQHPQNDVDHAVIVEMLNPSRLLAIGISKLRAMHRVVGRYHEGEIAAARCPDEQGGRA